jgi:hypothetical protein
MCSWPTIKLRLGENMGYPMVIGGAGAPATLVPGAHDGLTCGNGSARPPSGRGRVHVPRGLLGLLPVRGVWDGER